MVITDEDGEEEVHGIYAFGEGSLTWCMAKPGEKKRPDAFAAPQGSQDLLLTLRKDKP